MLRSASRSLLFLVAALLFPAIASAQLMLRDDVDRAVFVKTPAKRIVSLAPFITEAVYAAGAGDLVVGVDAHSDYPAAAAALPRVPVGEGFSVETVMRLRPDLVIAWRDGILPRDVERLTTSGITVYVALARQLEDVPRLLKAIGTLTSRSDATRVADGFEAEIERLRKANANKPKLAVFLELWNRPLATVSGDHFLSEALEICRGENIFGRLRGPAPKINWEDVQQLNPYVIVGAASATNEAEFRSNWSIRRTFAAVREERLLFIDDASLQRPTTRTPQGIAALCASLDRVRAGQAPGMVRTVPVSEPLPEGPFLRRETTINTPLFGPRDLPLGPAARDATTSPPPATKPAPPPPAPAAPPAAEPESPPKRPSQYGM